ncbi:NAD-dependent epimerase/dehydratase family protein [Thiolinea disciformis]|uniref:NAD-dependent epimerase/dehydratase family protein n=1 Tax=Thiolinea disciformis TaxID=125614 RepID=UPI00035CD09C|nr:NAD(P)-dependent oxidoreductase [Thiolinea disciformis]
MSQANQILVTGFNGFLGRHLCTSLIKNNIQVTGIDYNEGCFSHKLFTSIPLDLTNKQDTLNTIAKIKPDYLIHLASLKNRFSSNSDYFTSYQTNTLASLNLIEACLNLNNFKRFIFLGSCDEYGDVSLPFNENQQEKPLNSYGLSKLAITKLLLSLKKSHDFPVTILRPTVIYGPEQGSEMFVPALIQSLINNKDFSMTQGEQLRDFVYIDDVISAIIDSVKASDDINGIIINIGCGVSHRLKDIALTIAKLINPEALKHLKFGALSYRQNEVMDYAANISLAQEKLNWKPEIKLEEGLKRTIEYYQSQIRKD